MQNDGPAKRDHAVNIDRIDSNEALTLESIEILHR